MAWTRVTGTLSDSSYWHEVTSGVWFGKIPPNFYPLYTHPQGNLIFGSPVNLADPTKWVLSAGGIFNSAHNYSHMSLGLMASSEGGSAVAQICGPRRLASPAQWGIAYDGANFAQTPDDLKYRPTGSVGTIALETFPRSDDQPFTFSMMLSDGALTLSLLLNGTPYTLHTEQSYNTGVFAASLVNPFMLMVNMYICGTAKDQYEEVDDGEGGITYVGSPVCVLDWVNFASVE
jgi:hypothetical protein